MLRRTTIGTVLCVALLAGCATLPEVPGAPARLELVVIGDTPYDATDEAMLAQAVPVIKSLNPPFVLHVGDMKASRVLCGPPDDRFAALQAALDPIPVVYTPGDNEWSDCDNFDDPATGKPFSELGRLEILRKRFFGKPALADAKYAYHQQPGMPENARFLHQGLVFVTINVSGTNNGRDLVKGDDLKVAADAADRRDAANEDWLRKAFGAARSARARGVVVVTQGDMTHLAPAAVGMACHDAVKDEGRQCDGFLAVRSALLRETRAFGKPVFLIHGDTFPFLLTTGIFPGDAGNLWRLNGAGDAGLNKDGKPQGVRDVTRVWIDLNLPEPIRASGLLTGAIPDHQVR